ncbi:HNH endonuclease signature motif containing protein [Pseudonocardia sp. McavD-2-B]|uniref:HNH endonuclease signature motif containing protein n=1 Tax=Pseudonocardia sp. McavD-2-B TaxID=2954499 RepID=UPI0020974AEB|nr:HNH endonuclease signature motif containing protein [Pseudonocardia sp. McavD-2-B]MCO7193194.1 HNH endonuclease [Pseudonocardia sp. McavD-2-B]
MQNISRATARARVDAARTLSPLHLITGERVDAELRPQGAGFEARGWVDAEPAALLRAPLTAPVPPDGPAGARDERSTAERTGDGLVELARRMLAVGDLGVENGQPVTLTVTVPLDTLTTGTGAGLLGFGADGLSAAVAAGDALRLACDARAVPVVLGTAGEPLFVGREARLAIRGQHRALAQRDGGCAHPGCEAPPQWCVAPHVRYWADGGTTDLDDLVLLCPHHHRMVHSGDWTIEIVGGFPLFHPPPWVQGGPRRNPLDRLDLVGHRTTTTTGARPWRSTSSSAPSPVRGFPESHRVINVDDLRCPRPFGGNGGARTGD